MAGAVVMPQANGFQPEKPMQISDMITEMAQFDRIIKLRDEVLAGTHPRVKLKPAAGSSADAPSNKSQASPLPTAKLPNGGNSNDHKESTVSTAASGKPLPQIRSAAANTASAKAPQQPRPYPPAFGSSGIDPIFLTKSEDLIRAETKLERKRTEERIKEQLQQHKRSDRQRQMAEEITPEFILSDVLDRATELLRQMGIPDISAAKVSSSPPADSADEVTFYSSQVNDSPVDEAEEHPRLRATKPCKFFFRGKCNKGDACPNSHDPAFKKNLQATKPLTQPADNLNADKDKRIPQDQQRRDSAAGGGVQLRGSPDYNGTREPGEIDESSYSPPHTQQEDRRPRRDQNFRGNNEKELKRQDNQTSGRYPKRRRGKYSPEDGQIVRNQITSPIAPQPARVSPLAVAKLPRVENLRQAEPQERSPRDMRQDRSGPQSPIISQVPASRKRRRDQEFNDSTRNVAPRRDLESPIPYVKDEPMSPPPLSNLVANRYPERATIRSPMLEQNASPRAGERIVYQPVRTPRQYIDEPEIRRVASPAVRRVVSGPGGPYEAQREPELRRIVSARQPLRLISPQPEVAYYSAKPDRPLSRALSHAHAPLRVDDDVRSYRASVQPPPIAYARPERIQSPAVHAIRYSPVERESRPMAPPPRRIVLDQQGNRYYPAPAPPERHGSVLAEPRYVDEINDPIPRRASVRPEAARVYSDGTYVQQMSPPEPTSPRYVEYRHAPVVRAVSRAPHYEPYEDGYRPRSEAVRVMDYPSQRPLDRYEEPLAPDPRMHSLAPSYHTFADEQYEFRPREISYRASTTQPGADHMTTSPRYVHDRREIVNLGQQARHASVRLDDRERGAPHRQEYLEPAPLPQSRYQYVPTSQTYSERDYDPRDPRDVMVEHRTERRPMPRL